MTDKAMEIETGGEQTQYEGVSTFTNPPAKQAGTMKAPDDTTEAEAAAREEKHERGEQTAANIRYGQAISESGFGGDTTSTTGTANNPGVDNTDSNALAGEEDKARNVQQYGPGNNIGA